MKVNELEIPLKTMPDIFAYLFFLKIDLLVHLHADYMFFQMYVIYWFAKSYNIIYAKM